MILQTQSRSSAEEKGYTSQTPRRGILTQVFLPRLPAKSIILHSSSESPIYKDPEKAKIANAWSSHSPQMLFPPRMPVVLSVYGGLGLGLALNPTRNPYYRKARGGSMGG